MWCRVRYKVISGGICALQADSAAISVENGLAVLISTDNIGV